MDSHSPITAELVDQVKAEFGRLVEICDDWKIPQPLRDLLRRLTIGS